MSDSPNGECTVDVPVCSYFWHVCAASNGNQILELIGKLSLYVMSVCYVCMLSLYVKSVCYNFV